MKSLLKAAAIAAVLAPSAAVADSGLYYGIGFAAKNTWSTETFGGTSRDSNGAIGFTLGYRLASGSVFYGGELDGEFTLHSDMKPAGGVSCQAGALGPYYCEANSTLRLRGILGFAASGGLEIFGSAGLVAISGNSAVAPTTQADNTNTGFTFGVGVQRDMGKGKIRGEIIYDQALKSREPSGYDPDIKSVTAKLSYLF